MEQCVVCGESISTLSNIPLCSKECRQNFARSTWKDTSSDFRCHICFASFTEASNLIKHVNTKKSYHTGISLCKTDIPALSIDCEFCGDSFFPVNRSNNANRFCSKECEGFSRRSDSYNIRRSGKYDKWRDSILEQYECCVDCGSTKDLHVHHIVPVSEEPGLIMDDDNATVVCSECHAERHKQDKAYSILKHHTDQ